MRFLQLLGGIALFLYGIRKLSSGMEKLSGGSIQKWLDRMVNRPIKAATFGALATAMIQSSGMIMVMMIGLINANLMTLEQAISVMIGQEIGTTITGQIVSFKLVGLDYIFIILGAILTEFISNRKTRDYGQVVLGFGIVALGMNLMASAMGGLSALPWVKEWLTVMGQNRFAGVLAGVLVTAVIHSSATTALLVAMGMSNSITLPGAIAVILGANIGSCVTGLIASIGLSRNARRASLAQICINVIGVALFLPWVTPYAELVTYTSSYLPRQIANAHTFFNVLVSMLMFPFIRQVAWLTDRLMPRKVAGEKQVITQFIDPRLFQIPPVAMTESARELQRIADTASEMLLWSRDAILEGDMEAANNVLKKESEFMDPICNILEDFINTLMQGDLSVDQQKHCFRMKRLIIDLERLGDLSENMAQGAKQRVEDKVKFSDQAQKDLRRLFKHAQEMFRLTLKAIQTGQNGLAQEACMQEEQFDALYTDARDRHLERLEKGICKPEAHLIFSETIRDLERFCDHLDNLALAILEG